MQQQRNNWKHGVVALSTKPSACSGTCEQIAFRRRAAGWFEKGGKHNTVKNFGAYQRCLLAMSNGGISNAPLHPEELDRLKCACNNDDVCRNGSASLQ
jgi:hypothetical protein